MFQQFGGRVINKYVVYVVSSCLIPLGVRLKLVTAFGNLMPGYLPRLKCYSETALLMSDPKGHGRCYGVGLLARVP